MREMGRKKDRGSPAESLDGAREMVSKRRVETRRVVGAWQGVKRTPLAG
jgi:hypothetical protein